MVCTIYGKMQSLMLMVPKQDIYWNDTSIFGDWTSSLKKAFARQKCCSSSSSVWMSNEMKRSHYWARKIEPKMSIERWGGWRFKIWMRATSLTQFWHSRSTSFPAVYVSRQSSHIDNDPATDEGSRQTLRGVDNIRNRGNANLQQVLFFSQGYIKEVELSLEQIGDFTHRGVYI